MLDSGCPSLTTDSSNSILEPLGANSASICALNEPLELEENDASKEPMLPFDPSAGSASGGFDGTAILSILAGLSEINSSAAGDDAL